MKLDAALAGVLEERGALQKMGGTPNPSYLSEHMQVLSQYTSILEERVGEEKKKLEIREAELFKKYRKEGKSVNASEIQMKYDVAEDKAEVNRLMSLVSSSWRFISATQSRIKHLIEESHNQI